MSTPLYDELVVKHYLSKGIKPFSYPHEPVDAPVKAKVVAGDLLGKTDVHGNPHGRFDLSTFCPTPKTQSNGYFNL